MKCDKCKKESKESYYRVETIITSVWADGEEDCIKSHTILSVCQYCNKGETNG